MLATCSPVYCLEDRVRRLAGAALAERTAIFIIPFDTQGVFAITPRPRGGDWLDDDLQALADRRIDVLVSLLEAHETKELGLASEATACHTKGLVFLNVPIPDLGVPEAFEPFGQSVADVVRQLRSGRRVAVHCRQSVGRSGLFAVSIGIAEGLEPPPAINMVSAARGVQVPETAVQLAWLRDHATQLAKLVPWPEDRRDG